MTKRTKDHLKTPSFPVQSHDLKKRPEFLGAFRCLNDRFFTANGVCKSALKMRAEMGIPFKAFFEKCAMPKPVWNLQGGPPKTSEIHGFFS